MGSSDEFIGRSSIGCAGRERRSGDDAPRNPRGVAGAVVVRQRPARQGLRLLNLEDETGLIKRDRASRPHSNAIGSRLVNEPFLYVEGTLSAQDNVVPSRPSPCSRYVTASRPFPLTTSTERRGCTSVRNCRGRHDPSGNRARPSTQCPKSATSPSRSGWHGLTIAAARRGRSVEDKSEASAARHHRRRLFGDLNGG